MVSARVTLCPSRTEGRPALHLDGAQVGEVWRCLAKMVRGEKEVGESLRKKVEETRRSGSRREVEDEVVEEIRASRREGGWWKNERGRR